MDVRRAVRMNVALGLVAVALAFVVGCGSPSPGNTGGPSSPTAASGGSDVITFALSPHPADALPVAGDWDGDGRAGVGVYSPSESTFYLRNSLSSGGPDYTVKLQPGGRDYTPVTGDWNSQGKDSVGVYNPKESAFYFTDKLESGKARASFRYGPKNSGCLGLGGDWYGSGKHSVAVYGITEGVFMVTKALRQPGAGRADATIKFGGGGPYRRPIAGRWQGGKTDGIGVYSPVDSTFSLRNSLSEGPVDATFALGKPNSGALPVAGDWSGSGNDSVGIYVPKTGEFLLKKGGS